MKTVPVEMCLVYAPVHVFGEGPNLNMTDPKSSLCSRILPFKKQMLLKDSHYICQMLNALVEMKNGQSTK